MKTQTTLTLRKLILNDMDQSKYQMSQLEIRSWMNILPGVVSEVFKQMDFFFCSIFQKTLIRRQITQIQSECIYLLNATDKLEDFAGEKAVLKMAVVQCLEDILERVRSQGAKYLNLETLMPAMHLRREQGALADQIVLLQSRLKLKKVEQPLQDLIMEAFNDWKKCRKCMYAQMNHIRSLLASLLQVLEKNPDEVVNVELSRCLFTMEFNTAGFVKYLQQKIRDELKDIYNLKEQFDRLYFYQREYEVKPSRKTKLPFDVQRRKNREVMTDFIQSELSYLNNLQQPHALQMPYPAASTDYKIRFLLSVDALAYFLKLMVNAKMIDPGVKTELLAFVSRAFVTPGVSSSGISAGSLGVKYKQVVQRTATQVRAALKRMLKDLDEDFSFA